MTAEEVIKAIRAFIDAESKFIPDVHADGLLDRIANKLNELEVRNER